ncbi:MAG: hypothetical protein KBT27_15320 [Prevotellaceae bacterium]|nr:hypothetical protein [Candidatus Faecinaster equi]
MIRDVQNIDDDISYMKRLIRQKLTEDSDVIEVLNNHELDPLNPDDYLNENIFAYIRVPGVQDSVKNFICFSVDDIEDHRDNVVMKIQQVQFVVFCHSDDIKTPYGIERHDLLGYLIRDIFNWSNMFGMQTKLIYNKEGVTDTNYSTRTIRFEITRTNSLQKAVATNKYERR